MPLHSIISVDPRSGWARWIVSAGLLVTALLPGVLTVGAAGASTWANAGATTQRSGGGNPLAGTWGVYKGPQDGAYPAWQHASGTRKELLAKVALRPRIRWYGHWVMRDKVAGVIRDDIRQEQHGNPDVLVPIAIFREFPHGGDAVDAPLDRGDRRAYHRWVDAAARGIGSSRVLLILEPDLPKALKGWRPGVRLRMVSYASRVFGALPRTTVYLDAGAVDWLVHIHDAVSLLKRAGIQYVRGFAVGGTHYSGTAANIRYGKRVRAALSDAGVRHKHFVVDTADNARPFTGVWYRKHHPHGDFNNAEPCQSARDRHCVALGIPPTTHVTAARFGFGDKVRAIADRLVDGFVWEARPWLDPTKRHLALTRTLDIARTSPY